MVEGHSKIVRYEYNTPRDGHGILIDSHETLRDGCQIPKDSHETLKDGLKTLRLINS